MAGYEEDYPVVESGEESSRIRKPSRRTFWTPYVVVGVILLWGASLVVASIWVNWTKGAGQGVPTMLAESWTSAPVLSPQWIVDVRGGGHEEFYASLCHALAWLQGEKEAKRIGKEFRTVAVASAQRLYQTFTFPRQSRLDICAAYHDTHKTAWSFFDGHELMTALLIVMRETELEPKDISEELTAAQMRVTLVRDLLAQLDGYRDAASGPKDYATDIAKWQNLWNLTAADLGLTELEIAATRQIREESAREAGFALSDAR